MQTAKGTDVYDLLLVTLEPHISASAIEDMVMQMESAVTHAKKPCLTYLECLKQIEHHKDMLSKAIHRLLETYKRATTLSAGPSRSPASCGGKTGASSGWHPAS